MWKRAEIKSSAKSILKKNYWWAVLVALILSLVGGGISLGSNSDSGDNNTNSYNTYGEDALFGGLYSTLDDEYVGYEDNGDLNMTYDEEEFSEYFNRLINLYIPSELLAIIKLFLVVFVIVLIVSFLLSIFVFAPIHIGCKRWFVKNRTTNPEMNEVVYVFSNGYVNTVKVMFLKGLFTFLWSCLLIIPGIVKSYEYKMIPYLLAENPNMDYREAFARSKQMMNGNKWDAFVLDLSFFGWAFLSAITFGIVGIFYYNPYYTLTETELYVRLCQLGGSAPEYNAYRGYDDYSEHKGIDLDMFN